MVLDPYGAGAAGESVESSDETLNCFTTQHFALRVEGLAHRAVKRFLIGLMYLRPARPTMAAIVLKQVSGRLEQIGFDFIYGARQSVNRGQADENFLDQI